jgi:hypothetical protein
MVADIMVVPATAADVGCLRLRQVDELERAYAKEVELPGDGNGLKMPVSVNDESVELYLSFVDKPGIRQALENLDNSLVESLAKMVPGYINARWEGKPGIDIGADTDVNMGYMFANAIAGTYKYEDYSAQLEEFANQILADASAELNP